MYPSFTTIKVGFKGVYIARTCFSVGCLYKKSDVSHDVVL